MTTAFPPGRRVVAAIAATLGLVLVAGCSSSGDGTTNPPSGETSTAPEGGAAGTDITATINYAFWDQSQQPGVEKELAAFNEIYPNITVNLDITPWEDYWTKVQTQAKSDTLPDLFWMNGPNFQLYASNGKLEPITDAVASGAIDTSKFPSALVDLYTDNGVTYGVPKDFDTVAVWANKALFEQAGVDLPDADWTWDDFQSLGAEISSKLKDQGIYGAASDLGGQTGYYNTIFEAGGYVIKDGKSGYDTPEAEAGVQFWTDLIASGASPTVPQLVDNTPDQVFLSGKLAMYVGGSWYRSALTDADIKDDIVVLPLPTGKTQATVIHGVANVVAANSQHKEAAQALQQFLASKDAQLIQAESGVISAYEGTQDAFVQALPNANLQVFLDGTKYAQPLPVSANTAAWNALELELLPDAFSGARPVKDVLADLAEQMNAALAAE
jgi:multiple sugar transport system substrate-binding protein